MKKESKVKKLIIDALIVLLKKVELKKIKITELCEQAKVSRMSFYRNYNSVESIMLDELDELISEYKKDDEKKGKTEHYYDKENILHYLQYIEKNKIIIKGLYLSGYTFDFISKINNFAYEKWKDKADEYEIAVFVGILYNAAYIWAKNDYKDDVNKIADIIYERYV